MIDEIFEVIMKEARARPGSSLGVKIQSVLLDVDTKVIACMEKINEDERRKKIDENKRSDT
ncbi:unnamed protein product [marine sediment metagenome]|uniref:Uncharacterized protein n=1 Tax=marine sediment metagenome TaxID=412755 RepID=X1JV82_9ZZZZ